MEGYEQKLATAKAYLAERGLSPAVVAQRNRPRPGGLRRAFDGAAVNRLTSSFLSTMVSIDQELRLDLDRLRARSRNLANNNDYVRKFLHMVAANVVGANGFTLQARVTDPPAKPGGIAVPDKFANDAIESAFARWSRKGVCEVTGRMSFADLCRALAKSLARDGEIMLREIRGKTAGNAFGYALQLIDIDRLDTMYHRAPSPGVNAIIMGVEVNDFHRPVAYYLFEKHPGDINTGGQRHLRIPAEEIIHAFIVERPEQTRGLPWTAAAMLRLHHLKGYEEAAIINARVGAAKMGFFTAPDSNTAPLSGGEDSDQIPYTDAEAGTFGVLPAGYGFESFDPAYPSEQYGAFVKACLRGIASSIGVAYNSLANDLEGVNYSSIRSGVIEERDGWKIIQGWMIESILLPSFGNWLDMALLNKAIVMTNGSALPIAKRDKFAECVWQGRRWQWVDPLKDAEAAVLSIDKGLNTRQAIIADAGGDVEDIFAQLAHEKQLAESYGLDFSEKLATTASSIDATAAPNDGGAQ